MPNPTLLDKADDRPVTGWTVSNDEGVRMTIEKDLTVRFMGQPTTKITIVPAPGKKKSHWQLTRRMGLPDDRIADPLVFDRLQVAPREHAQAPVFGRCLIQGDPAGHDL